MAAVTETGCGALVTKSAGQIRAGLTRRYGPSLALLEQYRAPENQEDAETLDLVRTGTDGSPHRSRARPTPEEHPHHAGLELWMASCGSQIVSRPASWSGWCEGLAPRRSRPPSRGRHQSAGHGMRHSQSWLTPAVIPRMSMRTTSTPITTPRTSTSRLRPPGSPDDEPEADVLEQRQEVPYDQDEDEPWWDHGEEEDEDEAGYHDGE